MHSRLEKLSKLKLIFTSEIKTKICNDSLDISANNEVEELFFALGNKITLA